MIKKIAGEIAEPLTFIFNLSLAHGLFPSGWKIALVKPLHKKGSKSDFINYWPISIKSIFFLVAEKLIVEQIRSSLMLIVFGVLLNMVFKNENLVTPNFLR